MNHILFMSSDPVLKEKNIEILRQNGLEADGVAECLQGLVMMDRGQYDIVIIDDELSDVSGYEACLRVRQQSDVSIILLGSVAESEVWSKVEELGFDLYLRKPVGPRELLARIKALLRRPVVEKKSAPVQHPETSMGTPVALPGGPEQVPGTGVSAAIPMTPPQPQPVLPLPQVQPLQQPALLRQQAVPPQVQPQPVPSPSQSAQSEAQVVPPTPQADAIAQARASAPEVQPHTNVHYDTSAGQPVRSGGIEPPIAPAERGVPISGMPGRPPPAQAGAGGSGLPPVRQAPQHPPILGDVRQTPRQPEATVVPPLENRGFGQPQGYQSAGQQPAGRPAPVPEETGTSVLEDARIIKLVDALVSGKLAEITPVVDFNLPSGYAYPAVDSLLDTSGQETAAILDTLTENGILIKQPYERFYMDPDGQFQLVPAEHCPRDDSSNLVKGQLVEHFSCGYVGLDRDFKQDSRYVCPKCRKDLRLIGTDYRNIGIHYRCQDCGEVFTAPVIKWRNLRTRREWNADELTEREVYSYRFSPDKKGWLEFQLKPKTQLVDFLRLRGYQVQELAQLTGRSGAVHTFDVLAIRDDILTKINLGVGILVAGAGENEVGLEALFRFDTRAYDIGINYKVVIAIPRLGPEALNFANRQMIRAFEAKTLASVVSDITGLPHSKISLQSSVESGHRREGASAQENARAIIVNFLRNRDYEVYERALISGKSGVEHTFDIYARRDDKIIVPSIAIGIVSNPTGQPVGIEEIAVFDAAAFDSGIRNKVFLGLPQISVQAKQFAKQQKIDIVEQQDLGRLT